jgi:tight adherence protein C
MEWWNQLISGSFLQSEWLRYGLIGLAATIVPLMLFFLFRPRPKPIQLLDDEASQHELVLGDLTTALAGQLPGTQRDREQVLPLLRQGGYYRSTALLEYQAVRAMLVLVPLVFTLGAALLVDKSRIPMVLIGGLMLSVLGFVIPRLYVASQAKKRAREIERGLPVFADLLSIALLAGQSLLAGVRRVTDQLRGTFPGLASELDIVLRQAELLSLSVAFEQWAERSQVDEIRNVAVILTQSQKLGNDPSAVLMEFANNMRINTRQRADALAQRTSFYALFPTILCMWLPALVLLVGPVYYQFAEKRKESGDTLRKINEALRVDQQENQGRQR